MLKFNPMIRNPQEVSEDSKKKLHSPDGGFRTLSTKNGKGIGYFMVSRLSINIVYKSIVNPPSLSHLKISEKWKSVQSHPD
jgi:hypothetical protein